MIERIGYDLVIISCIISTYCVFDAQSPLLPLAFLLYPVGAVMSFPEAPWNRKNG